MISSCSTSTASSPSGTPVSKTFPSSTTAYRDHSPAVDRTIAPESSSPSTPPPASSDSVAAQRRPSSPGNSHLTDRRVESLVESAVHETVEATVEQPPPTTGDERRQSITVGRRLIRQRRLARSRRRALLISVTGQRKHARGPISHAAQVHRGG